MRREQGACTSHSNSVVSRASNEDKVWEPNGSSQSATAACIRRHPPTSRACFQRLTTHSKNRVGMAGWRDSKLRPPAPKSALFDRRAWSGVAPCGVHLRQQSPDVASRGSLTVHVGSHLGSPIWLRCRCTEDAAHGFAAARRAALGRNGIPAPPSGDWETDSSSLFGFALRAAAG